MSVTYTMTQLPWVSHIHFENFSTCCKFYAFPKIIIIFQNYSCIKTVAIVQSFFAFTVNTSWSFTSESVMGYLSVTQIENESRLLWGFWAHFVLGVLQSLWVDTTRLTRTLLDLSLGETPGLRLTSVLRLVIIVVGLSRYLAC